MADDILLDGSAATFTAAADDVGGVLYQRVKIDLGGDGAASPLVRGQATGANSLPVVLASDQSAIPVASHAVTNAGTFAVQAAATLAAETTKVIGTVNVAAAQTIGLAAGTAAIGKLAANNGVDIGDVDVASVIPGTAATNLGKAEDAAHASGDVGVMALAVRKDTAAALATSDADYIPLIVDANGRLHTALTGYAAADAAITGPPVPLGARASAALPGAMSADGDAVNRWSDRYGAAIVRTIGSMVPFRCYHDILAADATHTDVALQAAPGAGLSLYITDIVITNNATAAMTFKLEEDTASAKTQLMATLEIPASGGITTHLQTPIKLTANKDLGFTNTGQSKAGITVLGYTAA